MEKQISPPWTKLVNDEQWAVYEKAIAIAESSKMPFLLGGAFGIATYTGRWRNTKDLDFFVVPEKKDILIKALLAAGFTDYYSILPYDRSWIFRTNLGETIVDIIWTTPNHRTVVTEKWFDQCGWLPIRNHNLPVIPVEQLIGLKLYVLQRDRCDWPDVINLINAKGTTLNWEKLRTIMGADIPLLTGLLTVYSWLNPGAYANFPKEAFKLSAPPDIGNAIGNEIEKQRVALLDSRKWYSAFVSEEDLMQV